MAWTYQNKPLEIGQVWTNANGIKHSPQWHLWSRDEKVAAGLVEVAEEEPVRTLEDVKSDKIKKIKLEQRVRLSGTDWVIVRKADIGTAIPTEIQNHRDAIRAKGDEMEAAVNALDAVNAVDSYNIIWPQFGE